MKLSQWHDGSVKPVHIGWYECKGEYLLTFSGESEVWRYWDGKNWKWKLERYHPYFEPISASIHDYDNWRGIVK